MRKGGYELGYEESSCFWGAEPARLVALAISLENDKATRKAIDLGCGEGKNAQAASEAGYDVVAIELSGEALRHAKERYPSSRVLWLQADMTSVVGPPASYDLVISTGSMHCLSSRAEVEGVLAAICQITRPGGLAVISSFNDGPQDLAGHDPGFNPVLLPHAVYVEAFREWEIIEASNIEQADIHPNTEVAHSHSITRILARRL